MTRLALALFALALPAFATSTPQSGPYELQLLVDGQPARSFPSNGDALVLGHLGQRYTLRVVNRSGQRVDVKLVKPVNVYWVYVTAWATPDGITQFREDIYNRDGLGAPTVSAPTKRT